MNINDCALCNSSVHQLSTSYYSDHVRFYCREADALILDRFLAKNGFSDSSRIQIKTLNDSVFSSYSITYSVCRIIDSKNIPVVGFNLSQLPEFLPLINFIIQDSVLYPIRDPLSAFSKRSSLYPTSTGLLLSDYFLSESFWLTVQNHAVHSRPIGASRQLLKEYLDKFDTTAFDQLTSGDTAQNLSVYLTGIIGSNDELFGFTDHTYPGYDGLTKVNIRAPALATIDDKGGIQALTPWNFRCDSSQYVFSHYHGFYLHDSMLFVPAVRTSPRTTWNNTIAAFRLTNEEYRFDHFVQLPLSQEYRTLFENEPLLSCGFSSNHFFLRDIPVIYNISDSFLFDYNSALLNSRIQYTDRPVKIWIQDIVPISRSHYMIYGKFDETWKFLLLDYTANKVIYSKDLSSSWVLAGLSFGPNGLLYGLRSDSPPGIVVYGE